MKTKDKIDWDLVKNYQHKCKIICDEYHFHSALDGCVGGDKEDVLICKLYEYICFLESKLEKIEKIVIIN